MDYTEIMNKLKDASLFDLYRLNTAINTEIENPERIEKIKRSLKVGDIIKYFDDNENRLIEAIILRIRRTRASVRNFHDGKTWNIQLYMINTDDVNTDIHQNNASAGMTRNQLKIGDQAGFYSNTKNEKIHGTIIRLNQKTVTMSVEPNQEWRVSYKLLYPIIDTEKIVQHKFIEGVVI